MKNISLTAAALLCLMLGALSVSGAEPQDERQRLYMQRHLEKVQIESSLKYQEMLDKAGGVIINCLSCHEDEFKEKEDPR